MTTIKLRSRRLGQHVHTDVFMGVDADHLQRSGILVTDIGGWQLFGAALLLGAGLTKGQLIVLCEGDELITKNPPPQSEETKT